MDNLIYVGRRIQLSTIINNILFVLWIFFFFAYWSSTDKRETFLDVIYILQNIIAN